MGLPLLPDKIYHGEFGGSLFQTIYRHNLYGRGWVVMSLEWHFIALFLLLLATLFWPLAAVSAVMWCASAGVAIRLACRAPLPRNSPRWCRPLVAYLYLMQPVWRGWYRLTYFLRHKRFAELDQVGHHAEIKRVSSSVRDLYWNDESGKGRFDLLPHVVARAKAARWSGDFGNAWAAWDVKLVGDAWHDLTIHVATEELGWPRRFTRARCTARATLLNKVATGGLAVWSLTSVATGHLWAMELGVAMWLLLLVLIPRSRSACLQAVTRLIAGASVDGGFEAPSAPSPVPVIATSDKGAGVPVAHGGPAGRVLGHASLQQPVVPGGLPAHGRETCLRR